MMSDTINFQEIFQNMSKQIDSEQEIFTSDTTNPYHIRVANPEKIFNRPLNPIEEKMIQNIARVDDYSWNRDARGGLTTGFPLFDEAIDGGVQTGLYLFAAKPNVGKSAMMLQVGIQIADLNENVHVAYCSLDDNANELTPRYIACHEEITISQAKNPAKYLNEPEILEKRNKGIKHLYRNAHKFSMWDQNDGSSIEIIEQRIKDLKMYLPENTKIVLMIDSIYDLTIESKTFNNKSASQEYVAKTVKGWANTYDIAVMCTAHLRKLNGNRPTTDDLKENNVLEYESNFIALLHNEVGLKEENAQIYWLNEDSETKMPVIEMKVGKNKFGSFKGTRFYEFVPDMSKLIEAPVEDSKRYASLIYQG